MVDLLKWANSPYLQNWFKEEEKFLTDFLNEHNDIETVLDVGCGTGRILDVLKTYNFKKIVGIEKNPDLVSYLKEKYKDCPNIEIGWTNILFPEKSYYKLDRSYDLVLCMGNTLGTILNWKLGLSRILEKARKFAIISVYDNSKSVSTRLKVYKSLGFDIKSIGKKTIVLNDGFKIRGFEKREFKGYKEIIDTSLGFVIIYEK